MGTYWDDFISEHKQRILFEWNTSQMLEAFFEWLARQPRIAGALTQSNLAQAYAKADANYEDR